MSANSRWIFAHDSLIGSGVNRLAKHLMQMCLQDMESRLNHAAVPVSISVDGVDLTSSYRVPDSMIVEG